MTTTLALIGAALVTVGQDQPPRGGGVRATVQVVAEIVEPVTNAPRGAPHMPVRQVRQTSDGRWLVEFQ